MNESKDDQFELMDPDFGRGILVGTGFGSISDEEYSELVNQLQK